MTWTTQAATGRRINETPLSGWQRRSRFRINVTAQNRQRIGRSFQSRSDQTGRAFSLPARSGRLFLWRVPFLLKSSESRTGRQSTLFPEGIGDRVDLQEKSARLPADRCLNELFGQLRIVFSYLQNRCNKPY